MNPLLLREAQEKSGGQGRYQDIETEVITPELRLLLAVGFCGAFTTFSTFSLETWVMIEKGQGTGAAATASPFSEITDDDIDALFSE